MKKSIQKIFIILIVLMLVYGLSACRPTPQTEAVIQKGMGKLEEGITQTAPLEGVEEQIEVLEEEWKYQKEYDSGNSITVDPMIDYKGITGIPVIMVKEDPFEPGEQIKRIVDAFYPNAEVYDKVFTKADIEEQILQYQQIVYQIENGFIKDEDAPVGIIDPLDWPLVETMTNKELAERNIEVLNEWHKTAPDELDKTEYQLRDDNMGNSFQCNLVAIKDGHEVFFNFVNWEGLYSGSSFFMDDTDYVSICDEETDMSHTYVAPSLLAEDEEYVKQKEMVDRIVKNMGIDHMEVNSVSKTELGYRFYYSRTANDYQETYTGYFVSSVVYQTDDDGKQYRELWSSEHLDIETQNGKVVKAFWKNPSEVVNVENDNVKIMEWEQIQEIFISRMGYVLSPDVISNKDFQNSALYRDHAGIFINRVELGLTKLIVKDTKEDYRLVPTWSFMGHQVYEGEPSSTDSGTCFLTINAIDGSIVNRASMY